jgi:hypothetical protein
MWRKVFLALITKPWIPWTFKGDSAEVRMARFTAVIQAPGGGWSGQSNVGDRSIRGRSAPAKPFSINLKTTP